MNWARRPRAFTSRLRRAAVPLALWIGLVQLACEPLPDDEVTLGSCRGDPNAGTTCQEYFGAYKDKDAEKENCETPGTGSYWSDDPCPVGACGYCTVSAASERLSTYYYDDTISLTDDQLAQDCVENNLNGVWTDIPDVTCM